MKQLLLICAVVALVGCGKKEAPKKEIRVKGQRVTPNTDLSKAAPEKLITNPIVEKAIRESLEKPEGELTKADLEKVTRLNLQSNQLTNVKSLEKLTQLKKLYLFENQLTDVKGLENLTQLEEMTLGRNKLTSVKGLENLTQLKYLYLRGNPDLTQAQIDELQKALPNCKIDNNPTK